MLPQGCALSVLCRLRHCPFYIVVASVLTSPRAISLTSDGSM